MVSLISILALSHGREEEGGRKGMAPPYHGSERSKSSCIRSILYLPSQAIFSFPLSEEKKKKRGKCLLYRTSERFF